MERVLITGGTGLIGTRLTGMLQENGYVVRHLSRNPKPENGIETYLWDFEKHYIHPEALTDVQHIIHLAGSGIADTHWTIPYKKEIVDSRVKTLELISQQVRQKSIPLKTVISASGVNYYGNTTTNQIFTENDPRGNGFLAKVCLEWERTAMDFSKEARVVIFRTGTVLSHEGGVLERITKPVRFHLGAPLGTGRQWMPWIHIEDLCRMYLFALKHPISGVFNAVSSEHITNRKLTKAISKKLRKLYFMPRIPEFILKLIYGEMAEVILYGSRTENDKIKAEGFKFLYPDISSALDDLFRTS